jgi:hypothetical protein
MITGLGYCRSGEVVDAMHEPARSICRYTETFLKEGLSGFFKPRKVRGPEILTEVISINVQRDLDQGKSRREICETYLIKYDTIRKAIKTGRLREPEKKVLNKPSQAADKSDRSQKDCEAGNGIGIACTRPTKRILASIGQAPGGASSEFEPNRDVSLGGVLCALPALAANGLFDHLNLLPMLQGYYTTLHIMVVMAFMALCRVKSIEQLRDGEPGEWGKLLGLDRIPEVRCMREKLSKLSDDQAVQTWSATLSQAWMEQNPNLAGAFYSDGHVRLYHGELTKLPRRHVSRQRLCLRGTTDYWLCDALGQPFFSVERPIDHGLLEALRTDIVPRLLKEAPHQPTSEELINNRYRSRFLIIFDREGYSPVFFREMWENHRIACITYHKHPKGIWPEWMFTETKVEMPGGQIVTLNLAEMGSWIGSKKDGLWVKEVRKLNPSGHQTALISSAYGIPGTESAAKLFSRWCQENFFLYMMQNYAIDALNEYGTEAIPVVSKPIVNPTWRELDRIQKSTKAKLVNRKNKFADLTLHPLSNEVDIKRWEHKKILLQEEIEHLENESTTLKTRMKEVKHHIDWADLPEHERFECLAPGRKRLSDTVKLVAYRAETAMVNIVREKMAHPQEARALVQHILTLDADLVPDNQTNIMHVNLHTLGTPRANQAAQHLLDHLNDAEFAYPGTNLTLLFSLPISLPN